MVFGVMVQMNFIGLKVTFLIRWRMMDTMIKVMYQPRMDDPVCVARFSTQEEAQAHLENIKIERPKAAPHHYVENNKCMTQ